MTRPLTGHDISYTAAYMSTTVASLTSYMERLAEQEVSVHRLPEVNMKCRHDNAAKTPLHEICVFKNHREANASGETL